MKNKNEITFEVVKHIAVLSDSEMTFKELNLISYNGNKPKYDLRSWKRLEDGRIMMLKGLTMNEEEMEALRDAIKDLAI